MIKLIKIIFIKVLNNINMPSLVPIPIDPLFYELYYLYITF